MSLSDWPRLSSPFEERKPHYEVLVVGSGYGAGVAASRLARAGKEVCVLERGREIVPGDYPRNELEAAAEMQMTNASLPSGHEGSQSGLFDFHVNPDINVLVGCGLGGTSLINANVALEAEPKVFDLPCWPPELKADLPTLVEDGYRRAKQMLGSNPVPHDWPELPKMKALEQSAQTMGAPFQRLDINVTFRDGLNAAGVLQHECNNCGDCVAGCNQGAKNTTLMNYLPDAVNFGAKIFTQVSVRYLERQDNRWVVHCRRINSGMSRFDAQDFFITADVVVLGAGTLGTTEILLRSKAKGLPLSNQTGEHFTGNGDVLGFSYNGDTIINGIGYGHRAIGTTDAVGPCITSVIDLRGQPVVQDGMVIEEGTIPGAIAGLLPLIFRYGATTEVEETASKLSDPAYVKRDLEGLVQDAYTGPVHRSQTYLVMTHDDCGGKMTLENDHLKVDWPNAGEQSAIQRANKNLAAAAHANGAIYVRNPMWRKLFNDRLVTVHPLGGACIGDSAASGVVNHKGQVFAGESGTAVHPGLYACDGSVMPTSLGVNPLLTISALAERACVLLARDRGWAIDFGAHGTRHAEVREAIGIEFTESMKGEVTFTRDGVTSPFEFVLAVHISDLYRALKDPQHSGKMTGIVKCEALSPDPITVSEGIFNLFTVAPDNPKERLMHYRMKLSTEEAGEEYYFEGFKHVRNDAHGLDAWADTTTLYVTVFSGSDVTAPKIGTGILKIKLRDFARQLTTIRVSGAPNVATRLKAQMDFGAFFAGEMAKVYNPFSRGSGA